MTILSLKDKNDDLVIVPQDLAMLIAPHGTAIPDKITVDTEGTLVPFPGFRSAGELQKKGGAGIAPDSKTTDIEGYGSLPARRTVKTSEGFSLDAVFQELRDIAVSLWLDVDTTDILVDENGEWRIVKGAQSSVRYWSVILIGQDGSAGSEKYPYLIVPKCSVTKSEKYTFQMDAEIALGVTLTAYEDNDFGGYVAFGMAGKGNQTLAIDAGFGEQASEVQTVTISGTPTGGNFTLTLANKTTSNIAHNAASSAVQSAIASLPNVGSGNVTVTGSAGGPYTVTFGGSLENKDIPQMTANSSGLTGGTNPAVAVATTTPGAP